MGRMMWENHSLALPVIGFPETIRRFQRHDLVDWYQRYYTPDNLVICVAGPVDVQQVFKAVAHFWADWQGQCQGAFSRSLPRRCRPVLRTVIGLKIPTLR